MKVEWPSRRLLLRAQSALQVSVRGPRSRGRDPSCTGALARTEGSGSTASAPRVRVSGDGETWLADVGFGAGTPLEPMPFRQGGPYEQSGWTYRIVEDEAELVLQRLDDGEWGNVYAFSPDPSPLVDIEVEQLVREHTSAVPFLSAASLWAVVQLTGSLELLSDWSRGLTRWSSRPRRSRRVLRSKLRDAPEVLATRFGLTGFTLGADGRLALLSDQPSHSAGRSIREQPWLSRQVPPSARHEHGNALHPSRRGAGSSGGANTAHLFAPPLGLERGAPLVPIRGHPTKVLAPASRITESRYIPRGSPGRRECGVVARVSRR